MSDAGVLDRALRKSAAVWLTVGPHPARLVWAVWRDGALWVAVGGGEQHVPGLDGADDLPVTVTVRSPSTHSHLADVAATATVRTPDDAVLAALRAARRHRPADWARVYALTV